VLTNEQRPAYPGPGITLLKTSLRPRSSAVAGTIRAAGTDHPTGRGAIGLGRRSKSIHSTDGEERKDHFWR